MLRLFVCLVLTATSGLADDFRPLVQEAIKRGDKRIIISPGNYRLEPKGDGGELWLLQGLKDTEIIADGVTLTGTKLMRAITLHRCSGVTLRGLTVDYDPCPSLKVKSSPQRQMATPSR